MTAKRDLSAKLIGNLNAHEIWHDEYGNRFATAADAADWHIAWAEQTIEFDPVTTIERIELIESIACTTQTALAAPRWPRLTK